MEKEEEKEEEEVLFMQTAESWAGIDLRRTRVKEWGPLARYSFKYLCY